ncbi:MAG: 3-deoxy-manno-octulosonate cytidylyltransferase [Candidatus Dadabacteria bacterium]|nr:MAG: 3-deoxy-manno-octulosonate cytidylyltransferase [Candidatus Dadabacteria bacterium]
MKTLIIIPARYASSRFPGKPLKLIAGHSLIKRVYMLAAAVGGVEAVYVATDDQRIKTHVEEFGGKAVMTPVGCRNGSERVYAALDCIPEKPDTVINFQGDSVLTPPVVLNELVSCMKSFPEVEVATPAVRLSWDEYEKLLEAKKAQPTSGTLVVCNRNNDALYFSRALIPHIRNRSDTDKSPVCRHIGIYAYRLEALKRYLELEPGILEELEGLEQLRLLEHAVPVRVVEVDCGGRTLYSIDTPEDVAIAEEIIKTEGEPVSLS